MKITIWQLYKYFLNVKCIQFINNIIISTVQIKVLYLAQLMCLLQVRCEGWRNGLVARLLF